jgi:hypothetical protein
MARLARTRCETAFRACLSTVNGRGVAASFADKLSHLLDNGVITFEAVIVALKFQMLRHSRGTKGIEDIHAQGL